MAATRCWRFVLRSPGLSLHTAAEAAVTAPEVTGSDVKAAPVARYPPIVASLTADSKAARQRRVERWQATVHAAKSVDEKLRILTKMQFMKYVVYPQTFALNADRWYQSFTKTVFLSGLPPPQAQPDREPAQVVDLAALRAAVCDCLLQEHFFLRRKKRAPIYQERYAVASPFLDQLVPSLTGLLSAYNPVLAAAALGKPRAAFRGGGGGDSRGPWVRGCVPSRFSSVRLSAASWPVVRQAPLSMEFFSQEYWSGLLYPAPGDLPLPGMEPALLSSVLAGGFFTTSATWEAW